MSRKQIGWVLIGWLLGSLVFGFLLIPKEATKQVTESFPLPPAAQEVAAFRDYRSCEQTEYVSTLRIARDCSRLLGDFYEKQVPLSELDQYAEQLPHQTYAVTHFSGMTIIDYWLAESAESDRAVTARKIISWPLDGWYLIVGQPSRTGAELTFQFERKTSMLPLTILVSMELAGFGVLAVLLIIKWLKRRRAPDQTLSSLQNHSG